MLAGSEKGQHPVTVSYISPLPAMPAVHSPIPPLHPYADHSTPPPPPTINATVQSSVGAPNTVAIASPAGSQLYPISTISHPTTIKTKANSIASPDNYSYVELTNIHDFNYSLIDEPAVVVIRSTAGQQRRSSVSSLKKQAHNTSQQLNLESPSLIGGGKDNGKDSGGSPSLKSRMRCRYCMDEYADTWNRRGDCEYAPDCFRDAIEAMPGMSCARGLVYHCLRDPDGDSVAHPCSCVMGGDSVGGGVRGCTTRWLGLTLLSFLLPCLWCYPPLRALHFVGVSCGVCGGKHRPSGV